MRLEGQIEFAEILAPLADATIIVRVEDTRRADLPAVVIAEQRIRHVLRLPGQHAPVSFAIECPAGEEFAHYALRVHDGADAWRVLTFRLSHEEQARLNELLGKNRADTLTNEEVAELDVYERFARLVRLLKAQVLQQRGL